jgi:methylated-DNA-[protein]-cysteine S-methyltransferase
MPTTDDHEGELDTEHDVSTATLDTPIGAVGIVASPEGLRRILLPGRRVPQQHVARRGRAAAHAADTAAQLGEYLDGVRRLFEVPLDWGGVDERHRRVLETLVTAAPYGHTVTYGELGRLAGEPDAREIGVLMARNPIPLVVPCHRVVASDGLGGYGGGIELKRTLLELEDVLLPQIGIG